MTSASFPAESLRSSSDTLRHSSINSWERILQRGVWFWRGREDKDRSSCFISVGEPLLDGDANIFHLGKFSLSLRPCREICSVLWWLWECILLEHPFSLGSGAFAAPGFCNRCKSGNTKPQAQDFVSCSSPNPLELIIAKDILQREIISEKLPSVSLALKILSVGQILWLVPHSFRYQILPQNFWDVEHSYLGSQNTLEWSYSSECSRCSWELQRSCFIDSKYSAKT